MSPNEITDTLRSVLFPGIDRDIVTLGYVKEVTEQSGRFRVTLAFSPSAANVAEQIVQNVRRVLDEKGVDFDLDIQQASAPAGAPAGAPQASAAPPAEDPLDHIPIKIAVSSGKGGVGKSTIAVNLALAFAQLGRKVGLLDVDIYGPSIPIMLGLEDAEPQIDADRQKILPMERYGVKNISIGYMVDRFTPVIWRGPMITKAIDQLIRDVDWDDLEVMLFDLPPGTGDIQISLSQKVSLTGAIVVTTPQDVALIDAGKGVAMFQKVDVPILGIVENMSYFECPHCGERSEIFRAGGGERESKRIGVPFLGGIPIDPGVAVGGDTGAPVVVSNKDSAVARRFLEIAENVLRTVGSAAR